MIVHLACHFTSSPVFLQRGGREEEGIEQCPGCLFSLNSCRKWSWHLPWTHISEVSQEWWMLLANSEWVELSIFGEGELIKWGYCNFPRTKQQLLSIRIFQLHFLKNSLTRFAHNSQLKLALMWLWTEGLEGDTLSCSWLVGFQWQRSASRWHCGARSEAGGAKA